MLRLIKPAIAGQGTGAPRRRRRSYCLSLTVDEKQHLRAALHNLRRAYGTWACLADAMGVTVATLVHAAQRKLRSGSPGLALLAARAGGMTVEAVLGGTLNEMGRCKACGSRIGDRPASGGAS